MITALGVATVVIPTPHRGTGCLPRLNGSLPVVQELLLISIRAIVLMLGQRRITTEIIPTLIVHQDHILVVQQMLAAIQPISGVCLIFMAMFGNGVTIGMDHTVEMQLIQKVLGPVPTGCFVAAVGATTRITAGLRFGTTTTRTIRATTSGSGL